ncbi:hypothetical protein XENOCAPTIV_012351 [Xenoophorus captivus]|uniref:Inter-alpha-trypsin inhibitor heavy chain family member 6 n=1 Tax=Xenoophorus captivus TaxID=1517983 RepID=A0ABV0QHY6_9TELE
MSRYAVTTIQSSVWNQLPIIKEAAFEVDLPSSAFISNFTIEREIEKFRVAVSVLSGSRMSFLLTYEELLPRRLGRYELSLGLRPGQRVENLTLDVSIHERTGIRFIKVLPLKTSRLLSNPSKSDLTHPVSTRVEQSDSCARIYYSPTLQQQNSLSSKGLNADYIIQYDVDLGDLMEGCELKLDLLQSNCMFFVPLKLIVYIVHNVILGTNINAALLSAAQLVNPSSSESSSRLASHRVPLVIFLTDGEATTGVTSGDTILNNAKKALGPATLFGIAFGDDADFLLLKRLALENRGVARMVYEEADAALQLKGFYDEVANPLLSDIQLSYMDDQAFDVTRSLFPNYFQGSELVVAGRVKPGVKELKVSVSATDSKQNITLEDNVFISSTTENGSTGFLNCSEELEGVSNFVHRLWAYFTIKELLLAKLNATDPVTQRLLADKAINLSLKYNFVTPVTSLVVVKPDADEAAQALTTVKPTTTGTTTTTAVVPTKIFTAGIPRKLSLPSNHRPKISKPDPPQPPANKMTTKTKSLPKLLAKKVVSSYRKTAINPSLSPIKTTKATYSGKKLSASHNDSKTLIVPDPSVKIPTSLLNALNAAQRPAPERTATPVPNAMKITTVSTTTVMQTIDSSTSPHLISSRTDPSTMTRRTLPHRPSPGKTAVPSVRGTGLSSEVENHTKSPSDLHQSETTPVTPLSSPTPASAPVVEDNNVNLDVDSDLSIATLVLGTFAPMPGVTDGPGLWEATGFLEGRSRTYFDQLTISLPAGSPPDIIITLSLDGVVVDGEGREILPINQQGSVTRQGVTVTVDNHQSCWIELAKGVRFLVLFHYYKQPNYLQMAHLGFYITDGRGLSRLTQGLLGKLPDFCV